MSLLGVLGLIVRVVAGAVFVWCVAMVTILVLNSLAEKLNNGRRNKEK